MRSLSNTGRAALMPKIKMNDGTNLYYEEAGTGTPVVFVHEFAGDYRTWEFQVRYFSRLHRCVTYSQRGYPPSDIPSDPARLISSFNSQGAVFSLSLFRELLQTSSPKSLSKVSRTRWLSEQRAATSSSEMPANSSATENISQPALRSASRAGRGKFSSAKNLMRS